MANGENAPIWQVTRFCCTSGQCVDCHRSGRKYKLSMTERRQRIIHIDGISKATATNIANNWRDYDAKVEAMP